MTMNKEQLINVIWGATLMGGGGGGSIQNGLQLLETYCEAHGEPKLELISYKDMAEGSYAAVTAGMGSPAAIEGHDFTPYAVNAFALLQDMAKRMGKELSYCIPVELGGFNTFVPMLISLLNGTPFVDADGAGRAVPALDTLLLHVNGCATSPLAMASDNNDKITIDLANAHDAKLAEKLGRDVCIEFGMKAGLSGWMVTKEDIEQRIVDGSITLVEKIGAICRKNIGTPEKIFEELEAANLVPVKKIAVGKVTKVESKTSGGFDYGLVTIEGDTGTYRIDFQNENLLLSKQKGGELVPVMTVPDITCMYCIDAVPESPAEPGMPLSNADVKVGMTVGLGVIKVNAKWFATNGTWWNVWKDYLDIINYHGPNIPFEEVGKEA